LTGFSLENICLDRNVLVIFSVGLLSAFVLGIFELIFPFYLSYLKISLFNMGLIFSFSTLVISLLRILIGEYTDLYEKKKVYITSSVIGFLSKVLFSFSTTQLEILISKFLDDLQSNLRISVHNIMLFENARKIYAKLLSWFTASNFVFQAFGTISFASLLLLLGYSGLFYLLSVLEILRFFITLFYKEKKKKKKKKKISIKKAYRFDINRKLKILSISSAIATLGFGIAHGFLLPLYFVSKYNLDLYQISIVTTIHRLAFFTTPLADTIIRKIGIRKTYILSTSAYVISFLFIGLFTYPLSLFILIFIIHDLFGGGIGMTAKSLILQNLSNDDSRARDINVYNAIQTPMLILAPSIAGILATENWDYTFIVGGILTLIALLIFKFTFKTDTTIIKKDTKN
jgi:MFS family permease